MQYSLINRLFPLKFCQSALCWLPLMLALLLLDQVTKYFAIQHLSLGTTIPLGAFFSWTLVHNYGAAFGFLNQGAGWQQWFFSWLAMLAVIGFTLWLARTPKKQKIEAVGIILILSGALGNLFDRLAYGYVIDFIDIHVNTLHWPAFNCADSFICLGALLMLAGMRAEKHA